MVNNGSNADIAELIKSKNDSRLFSIESGGNPGYASANNIGFDFLKEKNLISNKSFLCFSNPDIVLEDVYKRQIYSILNLLVASLDGFFLNIILVRYLSLEDLGNYKIFFSVLNILIIFSINGLNTSVSRSAAKKYNRFFITATKISAIVSFLGTMIMIVLALTYYRGSGVKWPLLYACLFVPVYFGFNIWEAFYYGEKKFRLIFLTNLVLAVIRFGTCVSILYLSLIHI